MARPITIDGEPISDAEARRILVALLDAKIGTSRNLELRRPTGQAPDAALYQQAEQDMQMIESLIARISGNRLKVKVYTAGKVVETALEVAADFTRQPSPAARPGQRRTRTKTA